MRIIIAEDDLVSRVVLERTLQGWGHEVVAVCDGLAAWEVLQGKDPPRLAILDWMMPGLDGPEVCRRVCGLARREPTHLILLTTRQSKEDIAAGLESGAGDYITKPFDRQELQARVRVGERIVELQRGMEGRVKELENALAQVQQLQGLLPICSYCKSIRDDKDYWHRLETYVAEHSAAQFSHSICPTCWETVVRPDALKHGIVLSDKADA